MGKYPISLNYINSDMEDGSTCVIWNWVLIVQKYTDKEFLISETSLYYGILFLDFPKGFH